MLVMTAAAVSPIMGAFRRQEVAQHVQRVTWGSAAPDGCGLGAAVALGDPVGLPEPIEDDSGTPVLHARLDLARGDVAAAAVGWRESPSPLASLWRARAAAEADRFEDAVTELRTLYPQAFAVLMSRGGRLYQQGELVEALRCFQVAEAFRPPRWEATLWVGRMQQLLGESALALARFQRVIRQNPDCAEAYLFRGQLRVVWEPHRRDDIESDFRQAFRLAPDSFDIVLQWGYWTRDQGQRAESEATFRRALSLNQKATEPRLELARILCASRRSLDARQLLEPLVRDEGTPKFVEEARLLMDHCSATPRDGPR